MNNINIDGRVVKASLGTTKYCSQFLKAQGCTKVCWLVFSVKLILTFLAKVGYSYDILFVQKKSLLERQMLWIIFRAPVNIADWNQLLS